MARTLKVMVRFGQFVRPQQHLAEITSANRKSNRRIKRLMERAMAKMQKAPRVKDYGNDQINRLALAVDALERMAPDERYRAFIWFKSKYAKEWPGEQ